uniref:(California timema) hypothetical protein n=1 Tax=Timema californicum TaxID=61474 RepID=A0A7R9JBX4_TIMCA|nr:unnamed protein product [Timema californicum]
MTYKNSLGSTSDKLKEDEVGKKTSANVYSSPFPELCRSDVSINPSYTNLVLPYPVICRLRTNAKQRSYTRQLKKELYDIELNQMKALDGIRIHRIFTKDLTVPNNLDPLTQEQRYKIETILDRDCSAAEDGEIKVRISNRVDMQESLVDSEGYPRQDIDVYQVRHARHKIICLLNDHKAIMKEIEEGMFSVFSQMDTGSSTGNIDRTRTHTEPIARVSMVHH